MPEDPHHWGYGGGGQGVIKVLWLTSKLLLFLLAFACFVTAATYCGVLPQTEIVPSFKYIHVFMILQQLFLRIMTSVGHMMLGFPLHGISFFWSISKHYFSPGSIPVPWICWFLPTTSSLVINLAEMCSLCKMVVNVTKY